MREENIPNKRRTQLTIADFADGERKTRTEARGWPLEASSSDSPQRKMDSTLITPLCQ